jgi:hypothetical protein
MRQQLLPRLQWMPLQLVLLWQQDCPLHHQQQQQQIQQIQQIPPACFRCQ